MPMRHRVAVSFLLLLVGLAACGGDDEQSGTPIPVLPWPKFRSNDNNSGAGVGGLAGNQGVATELFDFALREPPLEVTASSPTIANGNAIYIGTESGVLSLNGDGCPGEQCERWLFETCSPSGSSTGTAEVDVGKVSSSPTITINNIDIVVASEGDGLGGHIFRLREQQGSPPFACIWSFPDTQESDFTVLSSSINGVDLIDFSLASVFIGTSDFAGLGGGGLQALNSDGTAKWVFRNDPSGPEVRNVTSSPGLGTNLFFTAESDENGFLYIVDRAGRLQRRFEIGRIAGPEFLPSPAVGNSAIYVPGANNLVFAVNQPDATERWRYSTDSQVLGSPGLDVESIRQAGGSLIQDEIVYVVDEKATLYGIRNGTGELLNFCWLTNQACTRDTCTRDNKGVCVTMVCSESGELCLSSADCPTGESCQQQTVCSLSPQTRCQSADECPPGESCLSKSLCSDDPTTECSADSCIPDRGTCSKPAKVLVGSGASPFQVLTSPAISSDSFAVFGTTDGRICAAKLDGTVPALRCQDSAGACTQDSCSAGGTCVTDFCSQSETPCDSGDDCPSGEFCQTRRACFSTNAPCETAADCQDPREPCVEMGLCSNDPDAECTPNSCTGGEACVSDWGSGCIQLEAAETRSSAVLDKSGNIYVTTEHALLRIE